MIQKWLSYLLIAMIAMQSVGAMAGDDHQSHQDGNQHLEFEHEHGSKEANKIPEMDEEPYSFPGVEFDCHHCCHCHNLSHFGVLAKSDSLNLALVNQAALVFHSEYLSNLYSPELRPPIV